VVDKYEKSPGVHNIDFFDYDKRNKFDAFLSISTFEHIAWDEKKRDSKKLLDCFYKIKQHVKDRSQVLVTAPLGYNDFLDDFVRQKKLPFTHSTYLIRTSKDQKWQDVSPEEALQSKYQYSKKYQGANSLLVGLGVKD